MASQNGDHKMDESVRRIQLVELDILKQVLSIIEENKLTYYALGGTLLGAIRHQGMIPWDDDIDIGMPRPDYESFLELATKSLHYPYQLHTLQQHNGEYSYYYARVENTEVKVKRKSAIKEVIIPVWIDIFPLDGVPNNKIRKSIWLKKCAFYLKLFKGSQYSYFGASEEIRKKRPKWKLLIADIFMFFRLDKCIDVQRAWTRLDKALKEYAYDDCDTLINFCGAWGLKELFPKSVYRNGRSYPFEDIMLTGPEDYQKVLTQMYGDYLTPPPEEKRNHHHIEIVSE